jgi:hypothetical protein
VASTAVAASRTEDGKFPKGVSGNPSGRPKGKRNELTEIKQDLEIAVRKSLSAAKITRIVEKLVELAEDGNVKAAKLILDKVISNAKDVDDVDNAGVGGITIRIENHTFSNLKKVHKQAVDAEYTDSVYAVSQVPAVSEGTGVCLSAESGPGPSAEISRSGTVS